MNVVDCEDPRKLAGAAAGHPSRNNDEFADQVLDLS